MVIKVISESDESEFDIAEEQRYICRVKKVLPAVFQLDLPYNPPLHGDGSEPSALFVGSAIMIIHVDNLSLTVNATLYRMP